jgi:hypothetical protein
MAGIGVDRMGNRADACGPDYLRPENMDADVPPYWLAIAATQGAVTQDRNARPAFGDLLRLAEYRAKTAS